MDARALFEAELSGRGLSWIGDPRPGRYMIGAHGMTLVVSLDNLGRQLTGDAADAERVASFTEQVIAAAVPGPVSAAGLYWLLEPNNYQATAAFRAPVSPRLDRVLAHVDDDGALIRWITPQHLGAAGLTEDHAAGHAWSNLDRALRQAQVTTRDVDRVALAMLATSFPAKASLLLAPSLASVVAGLVGWPVLAVAPDRDFVYLRDARHHHFIGRLGAIAAREHARAPYPLSAEVFKVGETLRAVGTYAS